LALYADDTNISVGVKEIKVIELKTAFEMALLEAWLFDNELVLNIAKLSSQQRRVDKPNIMHNTVIAYTPNIKFLGITLNEHLKWHDSTSTPWPLTPAVRMKY
jgi:hypothetical protein